MTGSLRITPILLNKRSEHFPSCSSTNGIATTSSFTLPDPSSRPHYQPDLSQSSIPTSSFMFLRSLWKCSIAESNFHTEPSSGPNQVAGASPTPSHQRTNHTSVFVRGSTSGSRGLPGSISIISWLRVLSSIDQCATSWVFFFGFLYSVLSKSRKTKQNKT